jgi:glutamate--cysteine ligase
MPAGADPRAAYGRWALDAQLLAVRREGGPWLAPAGLTFRGWLRGGGAAGLAPPSWADLDYHLSTLFPPVRARGHLELRALDAQPGDGWRVVVALVAALLDDPAARAVATEAAVEASAALAAAAGAAWLPTDRLPTRGLSRPMEVAARRATTDPTLCRAGMTFVTTAADALTRAGEPELAAEVTAFGERYPARSRCPADDCATAPEESA